VLTFTFIDSPTIVDVTFQLILILFI